MMSKWKLIPGYCYAVMNYLRTPKGRHDAVDYARAAAIITSVCLVVRLTANVLSQP